jgi:hypothetical protein
LPVLAEAFNLDRLQNSQLSILRNGNLSSQGLMCLGHASPLEKSQRMKSFAEVMAGQAAYPARIRGRVLWRTRDRSILGLASRQVPPAGTRATG